MVLLQWGGCHVSALVQTHSVKAQPIYCCDKIVYDHNYILFLKQIDMPLFNVNLDYTG